MKKILAFDIGGTKIAYSLVNEEGNFASEIVKVPTPKTAKGVFDLLQETIKEFEKEIDGVGIATAGAVNREGTQITSHVGNLPQGYNQTNFLALTDKPILVENDANAAAWAEFAQGAAKGCQNAVVLTLGTGVGSGIIVEKKLLKGKSGAAGEMHFPIDSGHKRKCSCGLDDCFEAFASGTALTASAKTYMGQQASSYDVIKGLKQHDACARKAFDEWQNYIAKGLIMLGNVFDPEIIVLSGSMAEFIEYETVNDFVNTQILTQPFKLKRALFENNAGQIGVALLLFEKLKSTKNA